MNLRRLTFGSVLAAACALPLAAQQTPDCAADFTRGKQVIRQLEALGTPVVQGTRCSFAQGSGPWRKPVPPMTWLLEGDMLSADLYFNAGVDADLPMQVAISINAAEAQSASITLSFYDKSLPSHDVFGTVEMTLEGLQNTSLMALQETKQTARVHALNGGVTLTLRAVSPDLRVQSSGLAGELADMIGGLGVRVIPGADEAIRQFANAVPEGQGRLRVKLTSEQGLTLYPLLAFFIFGEIQSPEVPSFASDLRIGATWHPDAGASE